MNWKAHVDKEMLALPDSSFLYLELCEIGESVRGAYCSPRSTSNGFLLTDQHLKHFALRFRYVTHCCS